MGLFLTTARCLLDVKYKTKSENTKQKDKNPNKISPFPIIIRRRKNISNSEAVPNGSADFRDSQTLTDCNSCCLPEGFKRFSLLK